jgi:hypothetical protein
MGSLTAFMGSLTVRGDKAVPENDRKLYAALSLLVIWIMAAYSALIWLTLN